MTIENNIDGYRSYCGLPTLAGLATIAEAARPGLSDESIAGLIGQHFKLTPKGIIEALELRRPIYRETARHGHFGRELPAFSWEKKDKADELRRAIGAAA